MVILGLGTNIPDRLGYLRAAYHHLQRLPAVTIERVSPIYVSDALLPENAPPSWDMPYLNLAIKIQTTYSPDELLQQTKKIEKLVGREYGQTWGPRPIDIDILAWDNQIIYRDSLHIPHEHLHDRPFALWPLADIAPEWIYPLSNACLGKTAYELAERWGSRFSGDAPLHTRQIQQRIDVPELMGIINLSPDSFSGDGLAPAYLEQAEKLVADGATMLDIGAMATGPKARLISPAEEWQRLAEPLQKIKAASQHWVIPPKLSVDTFHPETAEHVLALGIDFINDQSGLTEPRMRDVLRGADCKIIFMHQLGLPASASHTFSPGDDVVAAVLGWAQKQLALLQADGFPLEQLVFDIGIGFGKNASQSFQLIQNTAVFSQLAVPLLIGHSRKSFFQLFTQLPAAGRDIETLAISLNLAKKSIDYLRLHNVALTARALKIARALD